MKRRGFTLVELLVVIGIIAVLLGILLPTLSGVRRQANSAKCKANLHDIATQLTMYLNDSKGKLPEVMSIPSRTPPLPADSGMPLVIPIRWIGVAGKPQFGVLDPYGGNKQVFHCPTDQITQNAPDCEAGFDTYFDREGTSYSYDPKFNLLGFERDVINGGANRFARTIAQVSELLFQEDPSHTGQNGTIPLNTILVMYDWETFHNSAGKSGAKNYLFADMHVADDIN